MWVSKPMESLRIATWLVLAATWMSGCATIVEDRRTSTHVIDSREVMRHTGENRLDAHARQEGTILFVQAERVQLCDRERIDTIEQRTRIVREAKGDVLAWEWAGGGIGVGAGAIMLGVAAGASDEPRFNETTGEQTASDADMLETLGWTSLALGAYSLAYAVVDSVETRDTELPPKRHDRVTQLGRVPCGREAAVGATVVVNAAGAGRTSWTLPAAGRGESRVDLTTMFPASLFHGRKGGSRTARVEVDGQFVRTISLGEVAASVASRAWADAHTTDTLQVYRQFVADFRWAEEASDANDRMEVILAEREEQDWKNAVAAASVAAYEAYLRDRSESERCRIARKRIVEILIADERFSDARELLTTYREEFTLMTETCDDLEEAIARREAEIERRIDAIESEAIRTARGCKGKPADVRQRIAREAYDILDRIRAEVSHAAFRKAQNKIAVSCRVSPTQADAP